MSNAPRIPAKTGAEQDAVSRTARRALCYLGRPGVTDGIKRQIRRRERRQARQAITKGAW